MARQPILDRRGEIAGYELLYRGGNVDNAGGVDDRTRTTGSVYALLEMGLDKLVGAEKAFFNTDFDYIDLDIFRALSPERLVLEILEHTQPTPVNLAGVKELRDRGFTLAIDDYCFQPHLQPFLEFAEIVKLECTALDPIRDAGRIRRLAAKGKRLLAEKIEDEKSYKAWLNVGCELFQGYFFAKPNLVESGAVSSNKAALMNFIVKVHQEDVSIRELEETLASDVTFVYKLLRMVQSAAFAAPNVQTVGQAIMFLGIKPTAAIASVLALSAVDDRSNELLVLGLTRARTCEGLAKTLRLPQPDLYFTAGLLSVLDAYLNMSMEQVTELLPLDPQLKEALNESNTDSPIFRALTFVKAYERGDFKTADLCEFDVEKAQCAYENAVKWADHTNATLKAL